MLRPGLVPLNAHMFVRFQPDLSCLIVELTKELDLFIIFTHPDYRRRGVGQQFMNWGMNKADELGFDFFLDSTPHGRGLYEANKFVCVEENLNIPKKDNPDDKWKEIEEKVGPFTFWLMWRPVGGNFEEGKTIKPWEVK